MENFEKYKNIIENFNISGNVQNVSPYGDGHINSTICVTTDKNKKYLLQRINTSVFKNPHQVMENIINVTDFLKSKGQETLNIIYTENGEYMVCEGQEYYRVYDFIDDALTYQLADSEAVFESAGEAFGNFQRLLLD